MHKQNKHVPARFPGGPLDFLSLLSGWMQQGIESFSATQRIFGEVIMRQNAVATKTLREGMPDREQSPVGVLTDLAIEGTSSFIEAQKILLHLAQQENEIVMNGFKERIDGSTRSIAMTDLVRRSLDTLLRMQQDFLKTTGKQTLQWLESVKEGKAYPGTHLVDLAQEGMDNFIEAQKEFLSVIEQETTKATSGKHGHNVRVMKKTELVKLARAATNSFIDAQKKLLDVVGAQVNMNLKAATRTMELASNLRILPMASVAKDGVRSFVGAEKALIESIVNPRKQPKGGKTTGHHSVPGTTRRSHKVHAAHAGA